VKAFDVFYDPLDMTTCVVATTSVGELNRKAAADGLYFPLFLSEDMPIGELVLGYRFASRSFRFGPLCDNVLGFNFVFPSGKVVKVGAQVVKNVTGFDFARFLTNSGYRFGTVERVVLRLRSMAEVFNYRVITGSSEGLNKFRKLFLGSPKLPERRPSGVIGAHGGPVRHSRVSQDSSWGQVIDAFDFVADGNRLNYYIAFSCQASQVDLFDRPINAVAAETGCKMSRVDSLPIPSTNPFAWVKTTVSKAARQAADLVNRFGGKAHGFVGNAFFHYDPEPGKEDDQNSTQALQALHQEVSALGGHVRCEKLEYPENTLEKYWEDSLKAKWEALA